MDNDLGDSSICRIIKHNEISGTYFIAQRKVWKKYWFKSGGEWVWKNFCVIGNSFSDLYDHDELCRNEFKDIAYAEYACTQWVRVNNKNEVVKIWYKE